MRAIVFDTFGNPDVLSLQEVACPQPGPGQVRVAIYAAGTNPVDDARIAESNTDPMANGVRQLAASSSAWRALAQASP